MRQRRPAPLEQLHRQGIRVGQRLQGQTQGGGAGLQAGFEAAQHEGWSVMRLCGQLQAAQAIAGQRARQPGQQQARGAAAQRLLQRPQQIGRHRRPATRSPGIAGRGPGQDDQIACIDPHLPQGLRARQRGRREKHGATRGTGLGLPRRSQHRREQPDLPDARARQQQLGQRLAGPAAAGQLGVQRGETAGPDRCRAGAAQPMRAPQRGVQGLGVVPRGAGIDGRKNRRRHPNTVSSYSLLVHPLGVPSRPVGLGDRGTGPYT